MGISSGVSGGLPEWVRSYIDALNAHDAQAVAGYMTDDVVYTNFGSDERFEGQAAVRDFVDRLAREFSTDYRLQPGQFLADDTSYASEWIMTGTNDRAGDRFPATGQRFEIRGASIGRLRDGKIAENRSYWNLASYLMQVGLMPAPGAAPVA